MTVSLAAPTDSAAAHPVEQLKLASRAPNGSSGSINGEAGSEAAISSADVVMADQQQGEHDDAIRARKEEEAILLSTLPEPIRSLVHQIAVTPEVFAAAALNGIVESSSAEDASPSASSSASPEARLAAERAIWKGEAKSAVEFFYNQAIATEPASIRPIRALLESTGTDLEQGFKRTTRSSAAAAAGGKMAGKKRKRNGVVEEPYAWYAATPIDQLYLPPPPPPPAPFTSAAAAAAASDEQMLRDRQEAHQIWEQLELRHDKIAKVCRLIIAETGNVDEEENEEEEEVEEAADKARRGKKGRSKQLHDDEEQEEFDFDEEDEEAFAAGGEEPTDEELAELDSLSDAELRALGFKPQEFRKMRAMGRKRDETSDEVDEAGSESPEEEEDQSGLYEDEDEDEDDFDDFFGDGDDDEDEEGFAGASDFSDEEEATQIVEEPLKTEAQQMAAKDRLAGALVGEEEEEQEESENEEEEEQQPASTSAEAVSSSGSRRKKHSTLDDDFFSIDEFNRQTMSEEAQASVDAANKSAGASIGKADDVDLFADLAAYGEDDDEGDDAAEARYQDFFAPPRAPSTPKGKGKAAAVAAPVAEEAVGGRRRIRFNETVRIRHIKKAKQNRGMEDHAIMEMLRKRAGLGDDEESDEEEDEDDSDDDDDDEEEEQEHGDDDGSGESEKEEQDLENEVEDEDAAMQSAEEQEDLIDGAEVESQASTQDQEVQTARRVAQDLFAQDHAEEDNAAGMSTHERRQAALAAEIADLEMQNVGKKDWTVSGEVGSRARPVDSLLEEDLEFEHTAKVKPMVTEEVTATLEELIKRRILENQFDDVEKRVQLAATPFLPSKLLELSDSKSSKSLAELYEDEYQQAKETADGAPVRTSETDAKLSKEHQEIEGLFNEVFNKLDSLSNAHFTPKAPKTTIQNLANVATMSMESALPATSTSATALAPEEVYDPEQSGRVSASFTGAQGEMTPAEKKQQYNRLRKEKRKRNDRIERTRQEMELARSNAGIRPKLPKGKGGEKQEKADAMKQLIGNRGVSVVGKDGKKKTQQNVRGQVKDQKTAAPSSGSSLKL